MGVAPEEVRMGAGFDMRTSSKAQSGRALLAEITGVSARVPFPVRPRCKNNNARKK